MAGYFVIVWPNKLRVYNLYHFLNEIVISAYYVVLVVSESDGSLYESEFRANLCIYLVYSACALNFGCSLIVTVTNLIERIKQCLKKRRSRMRKQKYINKTAPHIEENEPKISEI